MSWFICNYIISEWNYHFQITVAHFVVSDLHKGVKIFAFFRGSRAGLIELQNTKLEEKKWHEKKSQLHGIPKTMRLKMANILATLIVVVTPQGFPSFFLELVTA